MSDVNINANEENIRIFIVRHGQTAHNLAKILQGHLDTTLNETGEGQAKLIGERLKGFKFDSFYSSDLTRCRQTSNAIFESLEYPVPEIKITNKLRERDMGIIEGKQINDAIAFAKKEGKTYKDYGEPANLFVERIAKLINEVLLENKHNKNVLLVSHGGTIRTFLKVLKFDEDFIVYNTSVTVVDFNRHDFNKFEIKVIGDTAHLGKGTFEVDSRVR